MPCLLSMCMEIIGLTSPEGQTLNETVTILYSRGMHVTAVPEYPHVDIYSFIEAAGRAEVCVDDVEDAAAVRVVNSLNLDGAGNL